MDITPWSATCGGEKPNAALVAVAKIIATGTM
jgi:hypothetical protein